VAFQRCLSAISCAGSLEIQVVAGYWTYPWRLGSPSTQRWAPSCGRASKMRRTRRPSCTRGRGTASGLPTHKHTQHTNTHTQNTHTHTHTHTHTLPPPPRYLSRCDDQTCMIGEIYTHRHTDTHKNDLRSYKNIQMHEPEDMKRAPVVMFAFARQITLPDISAPSLKNNCRKKLFFFVNIFFSSIYFAGALPLQYTVPYRH
jgi:hypothetical protein